MAAAADRLHDYALPATIAERIAPIEELARDVAAAPIELVVCVTDVSDASDGKADESHVFERAYSSRTAPPKVMANAVLASAAISALVLPLRVGDVIGTDGGWVRNLPLGHAYDNPRVSEIVAFRYVSRSTPSSPENLVRLRRRLEPFRAVPPVRALIGELRASEERQERGEPPHLADMIVRLMRITVARNTELEVRQAQAVDRSVRELESLRDEVVASVSRTAAPWRRRRAVAEVEAAFAQALPVPPRPRPAAHARARRPGRRRARPGLPRRAGVAARDEAPPDRARARADGRRPAGRKRRRRGRKRVPGMSRGGAGAPRAGQRVGAVSGARPRVAVTVSRLPSWWTTVSRTVSPGVCAAMASRS